MDPNRARLESSLTALLNRALLIVPYVRLDSVAAVTSLFQSALDYMQSNIIVDDDDAETIQPDTPPRTDTDLTAPDPSLEFQLHQMAVTTLASKLSSAMVTRDYSSPSQSKRSLSHSSQSPAPPPPPAPAPAPAPPTQPQQQPTGSHTVTQTAPTRESSKRAPLHIGVAPSTAAGSVAPKVIGMGIGGGGGGGGLKGGSKVPSTVSMAPSHKPSSRAQVSLSALQRISMTNDGADTETAADSSDDAVSDDSGNTDRGGAVRPYNKILSRAGTDFSSPKLGPRSLGASPATMGPRGVSAPLSMTLDTPQPADVYSVAAAAAADTNADVADPNLPLLTEPLELGKDQAHQQFNSPRRPNGATETAAVDDDGNAMEKDLVDTALERLQSPTHIAARRESMLTQLPAVASPKQIRSSLHLLSLAAKEADASNSNGVASATNGNSINDMPPTSSTTAVVDPIDSFGVGSPKPGFLRRLDSPQSHHGQLIQAKLSLSALMNKILQTIPQTKTAALSGAHAKLTAAIRKLEQSVTVQTP